MHAALPAVQTQPLTHISKIEITGLFGYKRYEITLPDDMPEHTRLLILYGDNGSGKTTILRAIFDLLSPVDGKGYKSDLSQIPFRIFSVHFNDGTAVTARRRSRRNLRGTYTATITKNGETAVKATYRADKNFVVTSGSDPGHANFMATLEKMQLRFHFLAHDRSVITTVYEETEEDEVPEPDEEEDEPDPAEVDGVPDIDPEDWAPMRVTRQLTAKHVSGRLTYRTLRRLTDWVRQKLVEGSSAGEANSNTVFLDVLKNLSSFRPDQIEESQDSGLNHITRVNELAKWTDEFVQYGLAQRFPADHILATIRSTPKQNRATVFTVLNPFIESYEARLRALQDVQQAISAFLRVINTFFQDKFLRFHINTGFTVHSRAGRLFVRHLSSGEQQMLLLAANTVLSRDKTSIVIIDEPELSLNVKWQRQLIDALISCAGKAHIQFILATHSIELLARHRHYVARLTDLSRSHLNEVKRATG